MLAVLVKDQNLFPFPCSLLLFLWSLWVQPGWTAYSGSSSFYIHLSCPFSAAICCKAWNFILGMLNLVNFFLDSRDLSPCVESTLIFCKTNCSQGIILHYTLVSHCGKVFLRKQGTESKCEGRQDRDTWSLMKLIIDLLFTKRSTCISVLDSGTGGDGPTVSCSTG